MRRRIIKPDKVKQWPQGSYHIVGAMGDGVGEQIGEYDGLVFYEDPKNRLLYKISGYMNVKENDFAVIYASRKAKVCVLTALIAILLILSGIGIWTLFNKGGNILDSNAKKYVPKTEIPRNKDENKIAIPGFDNIHMPEGDISHISLWNPDGNPCYFKFTIILEETGEELFHTELVEPGKAVMEQKLSRKLTAGSHPITIRIESWSLKNSDTQMNGGEVQTNLIAVKPGDSG